MKFQKRQYCFVLITFLLLVTQDMCGQIVQPARFEKEQKGNDEPFTVISLEENGIALLRETNDYTGNKRTWEIVVLDTALQEKRTIEFAIESRYPIAGYEVSDKNLYLLYRTGETNKNDFVLLDFDIQDSTTWHRHEIKPELDFKVTHFTSVSSSIVLGGYVSNDPTVLLYDMTTKSIKVVPGFFQKNNELVDLRVNQNETFNVVLIDRSVRSERKLIFRTYDRMGSLLLDDAVPIGDDHSLHTGITSVLKREDLMIMGTWGEKQSKQALGFFALPVDPFSEQKIKYYHFGELENFLNYLNPKREERIKTNTQEDLREGRRPSFGAYVVPYVIGENQDGFLMLAEVYQPLTNSPNPGPYGYPYYSNPYSYYNSFFPGYYPGMRMYRPYQYGNNVKNVNNIKTYQTALIAFDSQGNIKWDESIKLDDVEQSGLNQVGDFYVNNQSVVFLYKDESDLKIRLIDRTAGTSTDVTEQIKTLDPYDEIKNDKDSEGGVRFWTNNSFYVWGFQTLRNNTRKNNKTREVFYINKIVVH